MIRSKRFWSALSALSLLGTGASVSEPGCAAVDDPSREDVGAAQQRRMSGAKVSR